MQGTKPEENLGVILEIALHQYFQDYSMYDMLVEAEQEQSILDPDARISSG